MGQPDLQKNIIIVDDTPANLRLLSAMLGEQGYRVRSVTNGAMAINAAQAKPPDLILLDINMPKMNGYEVCRRLKEIEATADIPVIFLSALDDIQDKITAFQAGGVDYVTKPFHFEEVLVRVRNQLALRQAQADLAQKSTILESFSDALRALHRLSMTDYDSFPARFQDYLKTGCELLQCSRGGISKIQADYYTLLKTIPEPAGEQILLGDLSFPVSLSETYCYGVILAEGTVGYPDTTVLNPTGEFPPQSQWPFYAYLGTPIWVNGVIYGTLFFADDVAREQPFATHEVELVELMAQSLGRAIATYQSNEDRRRAELAFRLEKQKSDKLRLNILPQKIARRLKQAQELIAESFSQVTVLIVNVVNLHELIHPLSAAQGVQFLNEWFGWLDQRVERFGLETIKTRGDRYVVVGGVPVARGDHGEAIADLALVIHHELEDFQPACWQHRSPQEPIQVRMGIHTGEAIAGIIGSKGFNYDIWGEAINTATWLETTGEPNKIQVSEQAQTHLLTQYHLTPHTPNPSPKNPPTPKTYWLMGKKGI
ncbi:adenylate/guanylate cyclase domain-containing protein [Spirulina sp. CCNP1310]|uniref:adenylate/guanylate cyclase domain-containing protein n=1 Tax=Spirulina sp. CCNP1310 TaxID=3110249 RepID=UPI002B1EA708|nr:adenylate/guanylate cyclase domain-containing protein [Spirulina sp. CCNP1310]MEA5418966.1 adenylate/guanylate cyclase domain-containing protein [Spirulina sp. CCNP1310]